MKVSGPSIGVDSNPEYTCLSSHTSWPGLWFDWIFAFQHRRISSYLAGSQQMHANSFAESGLCKLFLGACLQDSFARDGHKRIHHLTDYIQTPGLGGASCWVRISWQDFEPNATSVSYFSRADAITAMKDTGSVSDKEARMHAQSLRTIKHKRRLLNQH